MKSKVAVCAILNFVAGLCLAQAGPAIGLSARANSGWCAPARSVCPTLQAPPAVITCAGPAFYYPIACDYGRSAI
ncbi:MAG TPA: hypothetical protein VIT23_01575, partial [Terrimicrobiaceae bacterium]